jgi:PHP family Zn ribbon phosphoesterase
MTDPAQACVWKYDEFDDKYDTACGQAHIFEDGGIAENYHVYCPYCGGKIREVKRGK